MNIAYAFIYIFVAQEIFRLHLQSLLTFIIKMPPFQKIASPYLKVLTIGYSKWHSVKP